MITFVFHDPPRSSRQGHELGSTSSRKEPVFGPAAAGRVVTPETRGFSKPKDVTYGPQNITLEIEPNLFNKNLHGFFGKHFCPGIEKNDIYLWIA